VVEAQSFTMSAPAAIPLVKGFRDVSSDECSRWLHFERMAADQFGRYAFEPIRLPVVERAELFVRSLGVASDIVSKEMFTFEDRDGTAVTLRPEATASAVRAYVASKQGAQGGAARYWYAGPMFRRERPQKGRFRQFQQVGVEAFGEPGPGVDAEVVVMLVDFLAACGLRGSTVMLGSLGDAACRPAYTELLRVFASKRAEVLCATCRERLVRNPLRLLDCKSAQCQEALRDAPLLLDHLCGECAEHFEAVRRLLAACSVEVEVAPRLVRGLDYYTRTAFEVVAAGLGAQNAVGGGGRYDGLVAALGGPEVPGFGFAVGLDRLAMAATAAIPTGGAGLIAVLALVDAALAPAVTMATRLRRGGHRVAVESPGRSVKAMLRSVDRRGARLAVLIGEDELARGTATVRDLEARRDHSEAFRLDVDAQGFSAWLGSVETEEGGE
jgi:histidyl-tRNA synthetase